MDELHSYFVIDNNNGEPPFRIGEGYDDREISHYATLLAYRGSERAVVVPEGVETIGEGAFRDCDSLRIVAFPFNLERIGEEAFKGCRSLTQVIWANDAVADGLVPVLALSIYREAFADCSSLREFGASVRILSLYEDAFACCTSLTSIWFKASIYGQVDATAFMGCDALEHVRISGVDEIEDETFAGLTSLACRDVRTTTNVTQHMLRYK